MIKILFLHLYVIAGRQECFCGPPLARGPHFENQCPRPGVGNLRLRSRMRLFSPSAVAPCSFLKKNKKINKKNYIYILIYIVN